MNVLEMFLALVLVMPLCYWPGRLVGGLLVHFHPDKGPYWFPRMARALDWCFFVIESFIPPVRMPPPDEIERRVRDGRWQVNAEYYFLHDPSYRLFQRFMSLMSWDRQSMSFWCKRYRHQKAMPVKSEFLPSHQIPGGNRGPS